MPIREKLLKIIKSFFVSDGIINTIKISHIVIIILMLLPLLLTITLTLVNIFNYDRLINNVEKANRLHKIAETDITSELRDIVPDFIVLEIEAAAEQNRLIKTRALIMGLIVSAMIIFALLFSVFVQKYAAYSVNKSIKKLADLSALIAEGNLNARVETPNVREFESLVLDLNTMAGKIKTLIDENTREQRNLQKSEMKALQAQITPHFLYNTMDSIIWLAEGNQNEKVISITRAFSDFFRISLNSGNEWIFVKDEFKHIESYLTIQKIRYSDIMDYSIQYETSMEQKTILKLLLQPLVENALYHGIKNKRDKGLIKVRGWTSETEPNMLFFSVEDNGIGMTEEQAGTSSSSYGLYNVRRRLELYYNRSDLLNIQSVQKEGTKVTLKIPEVNHV